VARRDETETFVDIGRDETRRSSQSHETETFEDWTQVETRRDVGETETFCDVE